MRPEGRLPGGLSGTWGLARLIIRRDRWLLALWIVCVAAYPLLNVSATRSLNPTAMARASYAQEVGHITGFVMLYGKPYGSSVGALATWRAGDVLWIAALVSLLMVIRHTRAEEQAGRRELVGAAAIGRHAGLAAALGLVLAANLALASVIALGALGLGLPAAGSIALALAVAAVGWAFAALAALAAQLTASAAAARGIMVAVLGAAFLLRATGDVSAGGARTAWLSWVSPLGWARRIRPFAGERWWVLGLFAGLVIVAAAAAVALSARRDLGFGVLQPRPGPDRAASALRSPLALAWRLHQRQLVGWVVGFALFSGVLSASAKSAQDLFNRSRQIQQIFERLGGHAGPSDVFLAAVMNMLGLLAAAYAVQAAMRLRSEETNLHAEPVLSTAVGRVRWAASHLTLSLLGPAAALAAGGLMSGLVYGLAVGDLSGQLPRLLAAAIVQLPAAWVLAAVTMAVFGLAPRLASGAWAAYGVMTFIWLLGASLRLNHWLLDISPLNHIPRLPGQQVPAAPLTLLVVIAIVLAAAGLAGFRRRDITA